MGGGSSKGSLVNVTALPRVPVGFWRRPGHDSRRQGGRCRHLFLSWQKGERFLNVGLQLHRLQTLSLQTGLQLTHQLRAYSYFIRCNFVHTLVLLQGSRKSLNHSKAKELSHNTESRHSSCLPRPCCWRSPCRPPPASACSRRRASPPQSF